MDLTLKSTCPYCSNKITLTLDPKNINPMLVRCTANACQKLYLLSPKMSGKEYKIELGTDVV